MLLLDDLPVEILLKTFCFCDLPSLSSLSQTCQKFSSLCADEILWRKFNRKLFLPICGPSLGSSITDRISALWTSLPAKRQGQLITNCKSKEAERRKPTLIRFPTSTYGKPPQCMHKVLLDDRGVWSSNAEAVFRLPWHFSTPSGAAASAAGHLTTDQRHCQTFRRALNPAWNVGDFAVNASHLVSGHWDGSLAISTFGSDTGDMVTVKPHLSDVHSVALRDSLLVSGSRDHSISLYNMDGPSRLSLVNFDDRIWSVSIHPGDSVVAVGTSGTAKTPSVHVSRPDGSGVMTHTPVTQSNLRLYDFEKETVTASLNDGFKHGFGTLATQFVDRNLLISGGHDGILRYWDVRQHRCVLQLDSDLDSAVYCFTTDGLYTVLVGYANYNVVCYFDRRYTRYAIKTRSFAQNQGETRASSSVYGLAFSPFELYVGLIDGLYKVDFCA